MDAKRHRFPWPANPEQRYSTASPCLAVVNARGPWAVWRHDCANPPFIPLCLDLLDKRFWRQATNDQRVFALTVWMRAAQADDWGIIAWGDPARLCYEWGFEETTFAARLEWMIGAGLACYLTRAEAEAVRDWRPSRSVRGEKGNQEGGKGGNLEEKREEQASKQEQARQDKVKQDKASQISDLSGARATQTSRLAPEQPQGQEQASKEANKQVSSKSPQPRQGQVHSQEPASLPKSDLPAGPEREKTLGHARAVKREGRPESVSGPVPIGDVLGWDHPDAVSFGRRMYSAIHGRKPPGDLAAAGNGDKADVGVWVHYWFNKVRCAIAATEYRAFEDRCAKDIERKRKVRSIRNLGGVARGRIVPGILAAMINNGGA
jgi:hypothetical protein